MSATREICTPRPFAGKTEIVCHIPPPVSSGNFGKRKIRKTEDNTNGLADVQTYLAPCAAEAQSLCNTAPPAVTAAFCRQANCCLPPYTLTFGGIYPILDGKSSAYTGGAKCLHRTQTPSAPANQRTCTNAAVRQPPEIVELAQGIADATPPARHRAEGEIAVVDGGPIRQNRVDPFRIRLISHRKLHDGRLVPFTPVNARRRNPLAGWSRRPRPSPLRNNSRTSSRRWRMSSGRRLRQPSHAAP